MSVYIRVNAFVCVRVCVRAYIDTPVFIDDEMNTPMLISLVEMIWGGYD